MSIDYTEKALSLQRLFSRIPWAYPGINEARLMRSMPDNLMVLCIEQSRAQSFKKEEHPTTLGVLLMESGNDLLSRAVSSQVPSALKGLTSVFGMGTGGSLSPLSPE